MHVIQTESTNYITSYLSKIGFRVRKEKAVFPRQPSPNNMDFLQIPCSLSDLVVYILLNCHNYFLKLTVGRDPDLRPPLPHFHAVQICGAESGVKYVLRSAYLSWEWQLGNVTMT